MWETLIDQTARLEKQASSQDAAGGTTKTWAVVIASVPVSIQPLSSFTIDVYNRRDIQVSHAIYTTMDLDSLVSGGETGVTAAFRFNQNGTIYAVVGVKKNLNQVLSIQPLYEIIAQQRRNP